MTFGQDVAAGVVICVVCIGAALLAALLDHASDVRRRRRG